MLTICSVDDRSQNVGRRQTETVRQLVQNLLFLFEWLVNKVYISLRPLGGLVYKPLTRKVMRERAKRRIDVFDV